ncbi:MAG: hypothetical protein AAF985_08790 [Bacteroidota bacterium]
MKNLLILLCFLPLYQVNAQIDADAFKQLQLLEAEMQGLAKTLLLDSIQENRLLANQTLKVKMEEALNIEGSFDYPFDSLVNLSFQYPDDRSFRIITWQLYVDLEDYRYAGYIQTNAAKPQVTPLKDQSKTVEDPEYDVLDGANWFGGVYYKLMQFKHSKGQRYLLFGYNGYKLFHKRKFVDVLYFENGQAVFGDDVFQSDQPNRPDLAKSRMVMTYSAETMVKLNYDENLDIIIFDNLIAGAGSLPGQGPVMVPDGSYSGYRLKKGNWVFVEKIFDHIYETTPRPHPILNGRRGKNVFGNR